MKIIYHDYINHKDDENYYGMKTSDLTKNLCIAFSKEVALTGSVDFKLLKNLSKRKKWIRSAKF